MKFNTKLCFLLISQKDTKKIIIAYIGLINTFEKI